LMGDIWAGLYKMDPRLKDEVEEGLEANRIIMERILNDESFKAKRELTRLDDLMSAVGTIKVSEAVCEWLRQADENARNAMHKAAEEVQKLLEEKKRKKSGQGNGETQQNGGLQKRDSDALTKAMQAVAQALQGQAQEHKELLAKMLQGAMQETQEIQEFMNYLAGGLQPGSGPAELKKVPLRDQIRLAELLSTNRKLKKIAMWAGR